MVVVKDRNKDLVDDRHHKDHEWDLEGDLYPVDIDLGGKGHYGDARELTGDEGDGDGNRLHLPPTQQVLLRGLVGFAAAPKEEANAQGDAEDHHQHRVVHETKGEVVPEFIQDWHKARVYHLYGNDVSQLKRNLIGGRLCEVLLTECMYLEQIHVHHLLSLFVLG